MSKFCVTPLGLLDFFYLTLLLILLAADRYVAALQLCKILYAIFSSPR